MNKKISLGSLLSILILVVVLTFTTTFAISMHYFNTKVKNLTERENLFKKIQEIDSLVRTNYFEKMDEETLLNSICSGYVNGTGDKYSVYLTAEEYNKELLSAAGSRIGIGVSLEKDSSGYFKIAEIIKDTPAEAAGLQVGNTIVKIENKDSINLSVKDAENLISGDVGTKVSLVVRQNSEENTITVTRRKITIQTVNQSFLDNNIGYIRITDFNSSTVSQFRTAINSMRSQNAKALILDVRNNNGGTMKSVCEILDLLLPEGVLCYSDSEENKKEILYTSDANEYDIPMVCLVNESTASAAELFAAALKDYDRATVIGTTTFGKGVLQNTFQLTDGSAVIVSTGYFYPPKSSNFNGTGITPDYSVSLSKDAGVSAVGSLDTSIDLQYAKALEVLYSKLSVN